MIKKALISTLLIASTALASDLNLGIKLYSDGLYSLAAKTFKENLPSLKGKEFKKFYRYAYLSFLKAKDYDSLSNLVNYWKENYPDFHKGELLALETLLKLNQGVPISEAFPQKELLNLPISEEIGFFRALKGAPLTTDQLLYVLSVASKNTQLKGAIKDSGLLREALKRAVKENDYDLIDFIFDNYGRWFRGKEEELQFIKYLERKKRFEEALVEAQKLYRKSPGPETRFELAKAYYLAGKYSQVLKLIKNPTTEREKYLLAWTYFKLKKPEKIPQVVGLSTEKPQLPNSLKVIYDFFKGDFDYDKLKSLYPKLYAKALIFTFSQEVPKEEIGLPHDLAFLYFQSGYFQKAQKELEKAVENTRDKNLLARSLFLLGKLGSVNYQVGTVVYNQLLGNFQNTPYYDESVVNAARVYLYGGSPQVAVKLLEYAENDLKDRGRRVRELLGQAYEITGDYKKAVKELSKGESQFSKTLLAYSLYQLGREKDAYETLKELFKGKALFPEANGGRLIFLSKKLGKERELKEVKFGAPLIDTMAAVITKDPKRAEELFPQVPQTEKLVLAYFLANYYGEKNPDKAFLYANRLIDISPNQEISSFAKAFVNYLAFKSKNYAPVLFNDPYFIAYNPENAITSTSTLISKAQDYAQRGEYGKAYGLLKLALERTTSSQIKRSVITKMVNIDLKQKNYQRALRDINLLPEASQESKDLKNFLLFKTYLSMGKLVDAYSAAKEVSSVKNIPEGERAYFTAKLARYYKLTGNKEKALELTEKLLKEGNLKSVSYDDLVSLSLLAQEEGELPLAYNLITLASKKAKTKEEKAESLFWKASIEAKLGRTDDAIIDYMKIAYEYEGVEPWASTALYRAAGLFEEKGDYKQALKLYRKVAKIKRGTKEGEVAEEKVKFLLKKIGSEE